MATGYTDRKNPVDEEKQHGKFSSRMGRRLSVQAANDMNVQEGQIYSMNDLDPALDKKMHLVNQAIDEIGWTNMHLKLFFLNGFGYAADSLILLLQTITAQQAAAEFQPSYPYALTMAVYAGMLVGALFWGFGADIIGRKIAFNVSLFICSVFAIVAGASPNWEVLALFTALAAFGAGGNLILDTAVFLEYLPGRQQWLLTLLACWWGLAPVVGAAFAWPFLTGSQFNCDNTNPASCTYANNKGWRYVWFCNGALVLIMSILRVTIIRLHETPKFLLGQGRDDEMLAGLQDIAKKYHRPLSLTMAELDACGKISTAHSKGSKWSPMEMVFHVKGLFATKKLGLSTVLIWLSWTLIGLAYPLFYVFLPEYLESRGAQTGQPGNYYKWRNYMIVQSVGIFGPVLAGFMCNNRYLGRRYTMVIGALITCAFFFAYTAVRTPSQNLGFSAAISFCINIYYGCLYAYTPEVLPSAHRTTGNGIAVACNRIMGLISAVVAQVGNTSTPAPIYVCAALFIAMAMVAVVMPFEPYGRKSM